MLWYLASLSATSALPSFNAQDARLAWYMLETGWSRIASVKCWNASPCVPCWLEESPALFSLWDIQDLIEMNFSQAFCHKPALHSYLVLPLSSL